MQRRLLALDTAEDIPLTAGLIVLGRHPSCDFRIRSPRVSRVHCCLHSDEGHIFVRDLNSTNGVRINGQAVRHAELHPGDVLSIAQLQFKCVESEEPSTQTRNSLSGTARSPERSEAPGKLSLGPCADVPDPLARSGDGLESSVEIRIRTGS